MVTLGLMWEMFVLDLKLYQCGMFCSFQIPTIQVLKSPNIQRQKHHFLSLRMGLYVLMMRDQECAQYFIAVEMVLPYGDI